MAIPSGGVTGSKEIVGTTVVSGTRHRLLSFEAAAPAEGDHTMSLRVACDRRSWVLRRGAGASWPRVP